MALRVLFRGGDETGAASVPPCFDVFSDRHMQGHFEWTQCIDCVQVSRAITAPEFQNIAFAVGDRGRDPGCFEARIF